MWIYTEVDGLEELAEEEDIAIEEKTREHFKKARKIVVKAGSNVVTTEDDLNIRIMNCIARELSDLAQGRYSNGEKVHVVYVSSGALKAGMHHYSLTDKPEDIAEQQALCSIGQGILFQQYSSLFYGWDQDVGQILVEREHMSDIGLKTTIETGWNVVYSRNVIPIFNYNDPVDKRELLAESKGGGNDELAARIAFLINADLLILLTDTDGLHTENPKVNPNAPLVSRVEEMTSEVANWASGSNQEHESKGGMRYKLAARNHFKGDIVIANGAPKQNGVYSVIHDIFSGKIIGTYLMREAK